MFLRPITSFLSVEINLSSVNPSFIGYFPFLVHTFHLVYVVVTSRPSLFRH